MAYYDEVYLKSINRYGKTLQDRIQNKKIHDFGVVLKKSPNQVRVFKDAQIHNGVLQTKTNNDKQVIDYLLMCKGIKWEVGTRIITQHLTDWSQKDWVIFHFEDVVSSGYNKYWILELNQDMQWIEDGIVYNEKVHFEKTDVLARKFAIQFNVAGVYLPNKVLKVVMRTSSKLKVGQNVRIGEETWKVAGMDKITVPGMSYILLQEDYTDKTDLDENIKLQNWTIQCDKGNQIVVGLGDSSIVNFKTYYGKDLRDEPIAVKIKDKKIVAYSNGEFTGQNLGKTECEVYLRSNPVVKQIFEVEVAETATEQFSIIGAERVRMGTSCNLTVPDGEFIYTTLNNNIEIEKLEGNILTVHAKTIGKDKIIMSSDNNILYEKNIEVVSIWMEE